YFRRVRRKDRRNGDLLKGLESVFTLETRQAHAAQRAPQAATLGRGFGIQLCGAAASLAMVGLSQVDELEVGGNRSRQPVGASGIFHCRDRGFLRLLQMGTSGGLIARDFS